MADKPRERVCANCRWIISEDLCGLNPPRVIYNESLTHCVSKLPEIRNPDIQICQHFDWAPKKK